MKNKVLGSKIVKVENELCIVKSLERPIRDDGSPCGQARLWYDVCICENGEPVDILESFKRMKAAEKYMAELAETIERY